MDKRSHKLLHTNKARAMSLTRAELNQAITETIDVMCTAEAVCRNQGPCGNPANGFDAAELLAALQAEYPASAWTAPKVAEVIAYMRARGIVVTDAMGALYLNWFMQRLGGENRKWAALCPLVEQPVDCITSQTGKFTDCTRVQCGTPNPAAGCCPPLV